MNILIITPNPVDTTSYYRAWGVFPYLKKQIPNLNLITDRGKSMTWVDVAQMDIVFMHRPFTFDHLKFAQYCKEMKVPLWMDYDDDLTSIPEWMSFHQLYMQESTQKIISALITLADQVTVSTKKLAERLSVFNEHIKVIPNALNDYLLPVEPEPYSFNKIVLWRGSDTHHVDLMTYADAIKTAVIREDWEWQYFGFNPWFLPKTKHIPTMDPMMYFRTLKSINPGVMFVPLIDNIFNRSKSNINWLEATYAGSVCLVPDWESWDENGAFTYSNMQEFGKQLQWLMSPESAMVRKENLKQSWETIFDKFLLSYVNKDRQMIINTLKA